MTWWYAVVEARHELQNPTSPEKIRELGERLDLRPDSHVLDIASGKGGPALLLAETFGCRLTCVERAPEFVAAAHERSAAAGLTDRIEIVEADAAAFELGRYDAALCLGASFVYGGLAPTVDALSPAVRPGGHVVVGEPFWRRLPLPGDYEERNEPFTSFEGTVDVFEATGLPVVSVIASSDDDWDAYETLHWQAVEDWLVAEPSDPDADEIRSRHEHCKRVYLRHRREHLGWAIFVGWKRP